MDGKTSEAHDAQNELSGRRLAQLSLAALGAVFGDIGTSPLYAIREYFHGEYREALGLFCFIVSSLAIFSGRITLKANRVAAYTFFSYTSGYRLHE